MASTREVLQMVGAQIDALRPTEPHWDGGAAWVDDVVNRTLDSVHAIVLREITRAREEESQSADAERIR